MHICTSPLLEGNITVSPKDAIRDFGPKLLEKLPLENEVFLVLADQARLFPPDVKAIIITKRTRSEKVAYFLNHVMEPGADQYLPKLLDVMKKYDDLAVQQLANEIQTATGQSMSIIILIIVRMTHCWHLIMMKSIFNYYRGVNTHTA